MFCLKSVLEEKRRFCSHNSLKDNDLKLKIPPPIFSERVFFFTFGANVLIISRINKSFRRKILLNFDFYASRNALHIEGKVRATLAVGVGNNICQRGREMELLTTNKLER